MKNEKPLVLTVQYIDLGVYCIQLNTQVLERKTIILANFPLPQNNCMV